MSITLSVLGMYNVDSSILGEDVLSLPEGVDRETLLPLLLVEAAELETAYPDPALFKPVCKAWSAARLPAWERMALALSEEYNPLHNYDRTEEEDLDRTETGTDGGTRSIARGGRDTTTDTTGGSSTEGVTGYNTAAFADKSKVTTTGQGSTTTDYGSTSTETRNLTRGGTTKDKRKLRAYGNIGVTTSAEMLRGELEVRNTDIYHIIAREFVRYFCLLVY